MYSLDVFDKYHVQITWYDIYFGIKKGLFNLTCVRDYAVRCLEMEHDSCQEISELAWISEDTIYIVECIERIMDKECKLETDKTTLRWQYCTVKDLRTKDLEFEVLSGKLDELYADFDYPEDMEEFISYMPIKDSYNPVEHTRDENITRIIKKVDCFLENKKEEIIYYITK